ncbi:TD and POZ domain-containing protein 5 [Araneus ventricosus]|uniref:TD and POZ domain-containing protein 5 n=1 Tax=Araneus ventricosus TaxID=182803 RepID=A0A4Y2F735_ARAVE|nr:TD and POZ domain-containing protein 5 [Araneus ventricosus]
MSKDSCSSFIWAINNYCYNWQKNDEVIASPMFCIYTPEETKWKLLLFPRGTSDPEYISFFLYRDKDCNGAANIKVEYSLEILTSEGSSLVKGLKTDEFQKDMRKGYPKYTKIITKATRCIQQDILTVRCKMIQLDGKAMEMRKIFARTIIGIEKRFFHWPIENFSNLAPDQTQSFEIKSESKEVIMQINLALTSGNEERICFGIYSFGRCMKFSAVKTLIIDSQKQEVDSGEFEYWPNCGKCTMFLLKLTKKNLIENNRLYLPNDVLTLSFEIMISTGFAFEGIEKAAFEYTSHPLPNDATENWRKCIAHKKISDCPCVLITDLTSLHKDQSTCDMKLQTKTNIFPVHTSILSARSPVFKTMFSNDMKEKVNGCVDVSDLQDETVRQFLLYLYSDQLEELEWDDALQLYKAADKYAVISLRDKCSAFLKSNLNLENACEALILSDMHQDRDLKKLAQNLVLKNANVIFKSEEFKLLAEANSQLALETMLRNWSEE